MFLVCHWFWNTKEAKVFVLIIYRQLLVHNYFGLPGPLFSPSELYLCFLTSEVIACYLWVSWHPPVLVDQILKLINHSLLLTVSVTVSSWVRVQLLVISSMLPFTTSAWAPWFLSVTSSRKLSTAVSALQTPFPFLLEQLKKRPMYKFWKQDSLPNSVW